MSLYTIRDAGSKATASERILSMIQFKVHSFLLDMFSTTFIPAYNTFFRYLQATPDNANDQPNKIIIKQRDRTQTILCNENRIYESKLK